jgi:hypothetical protein
MNASMHLFDMHALHGTLDNERRGRGLSWIELTAEINEPFNHTTSIPINVATVRDMLKKRSVTSAVVLQVLRWLGRTPESFLSGRKCVSDAREKLPDAGQTQILRFDTRALHAELDAERRKRRMTWKQVANELPGFTESMLANLRTGPLIGFPRVITLTQWLRCPFASFVRAHQW